MSDVLKRILAVKAEEIEAARARVPLAELRREAEAAGRDDDRPRALRGFEAALRAKLALGRSAVIAEVKKASPSKGVLRADFDPAAIAASYEAGGAACLSVLTDVGFFQGAPEYLVAARAACALPVLRKDFVVHPWQIAQSRALGADCVLLILAALDDGAAAEMAALALGYGMDVLVEVHDEGELDRAMVLPERTLIGINNRNLRSLAVDLATTERLAPRVPPARLVVGESGIATPSDLKRLKDVGVRCALVGESLMRQEDVAAAMRRLLA